MDGQDEDQAVRIVSAIQEMQLPHSKLLYIIARMFRNERISERQKLDLKCKCRACPPARLSPSSPCNAVVDRVL